MKYSRLKTLLVSVLLLTSLHASATAFNWNYTGTLSSTTINDDLGLSGETISLSLQFDSTDVWDGGSFLHFPTISSSVSITGGHTIATNTAAPALIRIGGAVGIVESVSSNSFLDFIIDGQTSVVRASIGAPPSSVVPVLGVNLLIGQLPLNLGTFSTLSASFGGFDFINESISVSEVTAVPEPSTYLLFGLGLLGLGFMRKRSKNQLL